MDPTLPGTFIGRAEELALLLAAEERVAKGQPAVSLVVGDAGIGRTRLLTEFAEQVRRASATGAFLSSSSCLMPSGPSCTAWATGHGSSWCSRTCTGRTICPAAGGDLRRPASRRARPLPCRLRRLAGQGSEGRAAELARHCLASHDLAGALAASVRAAREAERSLAPAEALRHPQQALRLWARVDDPAGAAGVRRVDLTLQAAQAAESVGQVQAAIDLRVDALSQSV